MHPSSFYDLRAHYVYTPLYGPYSLSEALEGLIFYSLDESRDSITISSKRTLRCELISELSNVVDDLQDYLLYFSSKFLISPLNSPDFIKELQAGYHRFEHLTVYWGALVTRLVFARKIVELNFWPHLFQSPIDNPMDLQTLRQLSSPALPNVALDKFSAHASALVSPSCTYNAPHSTYNPLAVHCQSFRLQSPQTMPSTSNPTGDRVSSLTFDSTPTFSASHLTRSPLHRQPIITPIESCFPQKHEKGLDETFAPPDATIAVQQFRSSIVAHTSDTKDFVDSKDDEKVVGMDKQVSREIEVAVGGEEITEVLCDRSHPVQLTPIQDVATGELKTMPARTSTESHPLSTRLQPSSMGLQPSSTTLQPSTVLHPSTALRPSSTALWPTPTAPQFASRAPYVSCSTPNLPRGSSTSFPFPHLFENGIPQRPTHFLSKGQHTHYFVSSIPSHSRSSARKRPLKVQSRHFGPRSAITPPFQRQSPPNRLSPVCLPTTSPYISNSTTNFHQGPAISLSHPIPFPRSFTNAFSPSSARLSPRRQRGRRSVLSGSIQSLPTTQERMSNRPSAARHFHNSTPVHINGTNETGNLKNKERVAGIDEQITEEIAVVGEGEELRKASEERITMPATMSPSPMASRTTSITRGPAKTRSPSTASRRHSTKRASAKVLPPSTAPCISISTANLHQGPTTPFPHSTPLLHSLTNAFAPSSTHGRHPVLSGSSHSLSATRKRPSKTRTRHFGPSSLRSPTTPPFQRQSSVISLETHVPKIDKNRSDEVFAPWNCAVSAQRLGSSTLAHSNNAREPENLRDKAEVGGATGQDIKEKEVAAERVEVTEDIEGLVAAPTRALSSSTTSQPMSTASWSTSTTRAPATTSSPTTALRFASTAPHISHITAKLHLEPTIPQPSARLLSKRQCAKRSTSSPPSHSLPTTQKQLLKPQPRGEEDRTSLNTTPPPSGLHPTQIPSNCRSSDLYLESRTPRLFENCLDEILAPLNSPIAAYHSFGSTSTHVDDARGLGDLRSSAKIVGTNGHTQVTTEARVVEGEEVTQVLCTRALPVQLTATHGELVTTPASMSSSTTASWPTSTTPYTPHFTTNRHQGPSISPPWPYPSPRSFAKAIHQPSACSSPTSMSRSTSAASQPSSTGLQPSSMASWSLPTASRYSSPPCSPPSTPFLPQRRCSSLPPTLDSHTPSLLSPEPSPTALNSTINLHPISFSHSIPLPHLSANAIFRRSARLPPNDNTLNAPRSDRDEHKALPLLDVPMVEDEHCPPTEICTVAAHPYSSTSTHTSSMGQGFLAQGQLGNLKDSVKVVGTSEQVTGDVEVVDEGPGFIMAPSSPSSSSMVPESTSATPSEISPMAQLMQEYSSAETGIMLVLSPGELTPDLIVDRGKDGTRGLHRYHLVKATLDNICMVVMAQQTLVQRAAALMVEGKSQFIVDPRDTLIPILRGTNSLPQLYVAWRALMARMRLGVKTWGKYVAEYQLQMGAHC